MLKSLIQANVKVNFKIDDITQKPNLTTSETIRCNKISFFYAILGFTQSHSGPLGGIEGFIKKIREHQNVRILVFLLEWIKFV